MGMPAICLAFSMVSMLAGAGSAGATGPVTRADPADPKAAVPAARYVSPLSGYRGFAEQELAPWREANDLVRGLGGWRAYASDKVPDLPPLQGTRPRPETPAAKPATEPGHSGHHPR